MEEFVWHPIEEKILIKKVYNSSNEVAQRIIAKPPRSNLLAISVQFYADARIIDYIKKESFWPKPKVDAAIIKIIPTRLPAPDGAADGGQEKNFFRIIKAGFSQPRKQLIGNLVRRLNIPKEKIVSVFRDFDISERVRAENLSLKQWLLLTKNLYTFFKMEENKK